MKFDPASKIQQLKQFGEFGDVNPSITDSSTYTFLHGSDMAKTFEGMMEGCFLYSRHWNPTNKYLSEALAAMEDTESAWVTGSGMAAIPEPVTHADSVSSIAASASERYLLVGFQCRE